METKNYAVLIDSDNISSSYIEGIFSEMSNYGSTPIRRIYGDFENNKNWRDICLNYSLKQMHQYNYTKGKNATDSSLIIDAMDILYQDTNIDGFVIVSSDSDFTGLAQRLREACKEVIGMGEAKTPKSIINACTVFKYLENLSSEETTQDIISKNTTEIEKKIKEIITINNGCVLVSKLKDQLTKIYPDFDEKNYGYNQMNKFLSSFEGLNIKKDKTICSVIYDKTYVPQQNLEYDKITIDIVKKSNGKKILLSELSQKLIDKGFNCNELGFSRFIKYVQTIPELKIINKNLEVTIK